MKDRRQFQTAGEQDVVSPDGREELQLMILGSTE
jgi:hypothetical protein